MKTVQVALVGIGGYGKMFLESILERGDACHAALCGVVQPGMEKHPAAAAELARRGVPVYRTLEDLLAERKADLTVIASPIQYHAEQTCAALERGSHVLCEKPACSTVQEALRMSETSARTGRFAAIGYQMSFDEGVLRLKRDILDGKLGKPRVLKALFLRARSDRYYARNSWAGRRMDGEGRYVLDSVAHNGGSHNIHNMLYMSGNDMAVSAVPESVTAELYRANPIENFDTAAARIVTDEGVVILFYGSHAVHGASAKRFEYQFERGRVVYDPDADKDILAVMEDGSVLRYGDPEAQPARKMWTCIEAVRGTGRVPCPIGAAVPEVLCIDGMQDSMPEILEFPADSVLSWSDTGTGEKTTYVRDLDAVMRRCFENGSLPHEDRVAWSRAGRTIRLSGYRFFR